MTLPVILVLCHQLDGKRSFLMQLCKNTRAYTWKQYNVYNNFIVLIIHNTSIVFLWQPVHYNTVTSLSYQSVRTVYPCSLLFPPTLSFFLYFVQNISQTIGSDPPWWGNLGSQLPISKLSQCSLKSFGNFQSVICARHGTNTDQSDKVRFFFSHSLAKLKQLATELLKPPVKWADQDHFDETLIQR